MVAIRAVSYTHLDVYKRQNFDRAWEGTMSDYYFDESWCRNISLDIRYTLFIVEKLGGAGWLLNEMKFAEATTK